ncbi:MAG: hypothetical protein PUC69_07875 [Ruminococcus sp.]|nr:hypothetical protein [Ruminococcus sp.]MDD5890506.1 hypothetical protein [Ruminococcus sp.]
MSIIKEYEEKFISAYCRLEYETWYQGYKDDVSKYLKGNSVCDALEEFIESNTKDIIKVSGEPCKTTEELYEFIESILFFLEDNDDYTVALALPSEKQQLADTMAYKITISNMNDVIVYDEMNDNKYVIQVTPRGCLSVFYINLYPDKTIDYVLSETKGINIFRGQLKIDANLYNEIYKWATKYVAENKIDGWIMGEEIGPHDYKFKVSFNDDFFGIDLRNEYLPDYESNKIEGHGALTKLLQLPELKALFKELKE